MKNHYQIMPGVLGPFCINVVGAGFENLLIIRLNTEKIVQHFS